MKQLSQNDPERRGKPLASRLAKVLDGKHIDEVIAALGYICGPSLAPLPDKQFEQWVAGVRALGGRNPTAQVTGRAPEAKGMRPNPLTFCLTGDTAEIVDRLLGEFLLSCVGKNDMAVAGGLVSAAAMVLAAHCERTSENYDEHVARMRELFDLAAKIAGEKIERQAGRT
jgi:hypothetical protein